MKPQHTKITTTQIPNMSGFTHNGPWSVFVLVEFAGGVSGRITCHEKDPYVSLVRARLSNAEVGIVPDTIARHLLRVGEAALRSNGERAALTTHNPATQFTREA